MKTKIISNANIHFGVLTIGFELGDIVLKVPIRLKNVEVKRLLGVVIVLVLTRSSGSTSGKLTPGFRLLAALCVVRKLRVGVPYFWTARAIAGEAVLV
jgi:hypothetical protein